MHVDLGDRVEIGPNADGSFCYVAPDSLPIVTRGPVIQDKLDLWFVATAGIGSKGGFTGVVGIYPVRQFLDKADAIALHDMILCGDVKWSEAIEVRIANGRREIIGTPKLLVGSNVPSIADLHQGRRGLR